MTEARHGGDGRLIPFVFDAKQVRVLIRDDEPWFVAADVCRCLGIKNTAQAVAALDADERSRFNLGRQGEANCLSEGGLFALILRCRTAMTPGSAPHRFRRLIPRARYPHTPLRSPWLEAEFGWTDMTAQRFMQVHRMVKSNKLLDLARYLLAAPSTPEPARQIATGIAASGQRVTHAVAQGVRQGLQAEFGWSDDTANRFMRVYEMVKSRNLRDLPSFEVSALYLLAAPSRRAA